MKRAKLAKMYNDHAGEIYKYIYHHVNDVELAEDILADTFLKALKNIDNFDFKYPKAWLYQIAKNTLTDNYKKKKPVALEDYMDESDDAHLEIERKAENSLTKTLLDKKMKDLPEKQREIVELRFKHNLSAKEVAKIMDFSEANVRVMQFRALKSLREVL